jgi:hypothetical protein
MGLFGDSAAEREKTGDLDANLWTGIAMLVFALAFALWSRLRPVVVEERPAEDDDRPAH